MISKIFNGKKYICNKNINLYGFLDNRKRFIILRKAITYLTNLYNKLNLITLKM